MLLVGTRKEPRAPQPQRNHDPKIEGYCLQAAKINPKKFAIYKRNML
jgi:hypothetical protein